MHNWHSQTVRHCAEMILWLGDAEGYRNAVRQLREIVEASSVRQDWIACSVSCDLAVLYAKAAESQMSADHLSKARRLYEGKEPGVQTERGNRALMASSLSGAYRDIGEIDLALRFGRRAPADDRSMHLVSSLIVGGRAAAAEAELAKLDSPWERASLIERSLTADFRINGREILRPHPPGVPTCRAP
jgi:hypothetical protein